MFKWFRGILLGTTALAMTCCSGCHKQGDIQHNEAPASNDVITWLKSNAIPIDTCEPVSTLADLTALRDVIGTARVVALGEATHGTSEFFKLKHRLLEYLVSDLGFNVFAIEANFPEALRMNQYVLTGEGDPSKVLSGLHFWTWDTQEVLEMVRWMRLYNSDPKHCNKLKFYGIDMQYGEQAKNDVLAYLTTVDPQYLQVARVQLQFANDQVSSRHDVADVEALKYRAAVEGLLKHMRDHRQKYVASFGEGKWEMAYQEALIIQQNTEFILSKRIDSARDKAMADNAIWLLQHEANGSKMVLWAHNMHTSFWSYDVPSEKPWRPMGAYLKRQLGADYLSFGFIFNEGGFNARDRRPSQGHGELRAFYLGPCPDGTIPATLNKLNLPILAIDFRKLPKAGKVRDWWEQPHWWLSIGAVFSSDDRSGWLMNSIVHEYDCAIFIAKTTPAHPTPGGVRLAEKANK